MKNGGKLYIEGNAKDGDDDVVVDAVGASGPTNDDDEVVGLGFVSELLSDTLLAEGDIVYYKLICS